MKKEYMEMVERIDAIPRTEYPELGTYLVWKQDLQKNGKTPEDAVAFARKHGGEGYAEMLAQFIEKMEAACSEP